MDTHKQIWYDPVYISTHLEKLRKTVSNDELNKNRKHQKTREAGVGMIVALALYEITNIPHYLRVLAEKEEPPDLQMMYIDPNNPGTIVVTNLEISTFTNSSQEGFQSQLERKVPANYNKYTEKEILIYHTDSFQKIDTVKAHKYLSHVKPPFPVWLIQIDKDSSGNTVALIFVIYPKHFRTPLMNTAKYADKFVKTGHPPVIRTIKTGSKKNVKITPSDTHKETPWDHC